MDDKKRLDLQKLRDHPWLQSTTASRKHLSIAITQLSDLQANLNLNATYDALQECIDNNAVDTFEKSHPSLAKRREGRTKSPAATTSRRTLEEDEAARRYALERASTETGPFEEEFIEGRSKSSGIAGMSDPNEDDEEMENAGEEIPHSESYVEEIMDSDNDDDCVSPLPDELPIVGTNPYVIGLEMKAREAYKLEKLERDQERERERALELQAIQQAMSEENKENKEADEHVKIQEKDSEHVAEIDEIQEQSQEDAEDVQQFKTTENVQIEHEHLVVNESVYEIMEVDEKALEVDKADEPKNLQNEEICEAIVMPQVDEQPKPLYMGKWKSKFEYFVHRHDSVDENGFLGFTAEEMLPHYEENFFLGFEEPIKEKIHVVERLTRQQKRRLEVDCIEVELYLELQPAKRTRRACRNK